MKKEVYVKMADVEENHWWFRSRTRIIETFLKKENRSNLEILDLGCASGKNFKMLSKYGEITGFEPEEYSINIARQKGIAKNIIQGFLPQDEKKIKESFDTVVMTDVLEHIEYDEQTLEVIHRILSSEGKLLITVPALMWLWGHHDETHYHFRRYTKKELSEKLVDAGFEISFISYYNFFLFPLIAGIRIIKKSIPRLRDSDDLSKEPNSLINKVLEFIFSSERFFLRSGIKFPIGVSIIAYVKKKD